MNETARGGRRGRLPAELADRRRMEILADARSELLAVGFDKLTMLGLARRCNASKETLYSWFGSKEGLVAMLIAEEGSNTIEGLRAAFTDPEIEPRTALQGFARSLLALLCSPWSIALNRSATRSADLGALLLQHGRHSVGPIVEQMLEHLHALGILTIADPPAAFRELYGLIVQDTQIRVLLGEDPPRLAEQHAQAHAAVEAFWALHQPATARNQRKPRAKFAR
jgi:AcrR family transcriptional regulator